MCGYSFSCEVLPGVRGENAHRQGLIDVAAVRDEIECGSSLSGKVGNRSSPPAVH